MLSFKGARFPRDVIVHAVFFCVRYGVPYRGLEETLGGGRVDHATLNRWVVKYASPLASVAQRKKSRTVLSWHLKETYVKVRGEWCYLYRAGDRSGQVLDFMLSKHRDEAAALWFLDQAVGTDGLAKACAIDKSGANTAACKNLNDASKTVGSRQRARGDRSKYLNNTVQQGRRNIKRRIRSMTGFNNSRPAAAPLDGIETAQMIPKGQLASLAIRVSCTKAPVARPAQHAAASVRILNVIHNLLGGMRSGWTLLVRQGRYKSRKCYDRRPAICR